MPQSAAPHYLPLYPLPPHAFGTTTPCLWEGQRADAALKEIGAWMDRQSLTRTALPRDKEQKLEKLAEQAQAGQWRVALLFNVAMTRDGRLQPLVDVSKFILMLGVDLH